MAQAGLAQGIGEELGSIGRAVVSHHPLDADTATAQHRIAALMSQAFVNFAATGDPGQPGLVWPAYDPQRVQTMVFDAQTKVVADPAGDLVRLLA